MARHTNELQTIRSEGGLLPPDLLRRILDPKEKLDGTQPEDYGLPQGERLNEVITQSWARLRKHWAEFRTAAANLPAGEAGTGITNDKWSLPLLRELGFGLLPTSASPEIGGRVYAINRLFGPVPIHLVGCGASLDHRAAGVRGAAVSSPHGLAQEFLNRSAAHMWGIVSNGSLFRILRDNQALSRQSFLEFDLEAMFTGELYADFVLLWLIAHATRFAPREADKPESCRLEAWTKVANEQGTRALQDLRGAVEKALQILGEGFTAHPKNKALRDTLRTGQASLANFHAQLLRVVYRFIFLSVAEDRTLDGQSLLHPRDGSEAARVARERYAANYSTARLRDLASSIKGSRHGDLWRQFQVIVGTLSGDPNFAAAREHLALPALGSFLWDPSSTSTLNHAELTNHDFLEALRHLAFTRPDKVLRPVDFRNLGAEELGGVYETLLSLTPQISADGARFTFAEFAGNERKTSGSYYTADSLVQCLLDSALDPVVEEALKGKRGSDAEKAILALKVCDPAVGSGHFLVGAAHRLARHLARVRAAAQGESEPSPLLYQHALRDVIGHCLYGVDINPMAAELCRVSLWLEALEPGKPLSFLEHRIQCGNSLLGATPALLAKGIPDDAFNPIEGDDKEICREFKRINNDEHNRQTRLFAASTEPWQQLGNLAMSLANLEAVGDESLEGIREKQRIYEQTIRSSDYLSGHFWADAWCAAFVWKKTREFNYPITEEVFRRVEQDPLAVDPWMRDEIMRLAAEYHFFHWHLAFPDVFRVLPTDMAPENKQMGWNGGFDVVLGNPPWERVQFEERSFFSASAPDIYAESNQSRRRALIHDLAAKDPRLFGRWQAASRDMEAETQLIRESMRFPLSAIDKFNTYAIFTELGLHLTNTQGTCGLIVKAGLITDKLCAALFSASLRSRRLSAAYEFENRNKLFPEVDSRERFALVVFEHNIREAEFTFDNLSVERAKAEDRILRMSYEDIMLLSPNTGNCPKFPSPHELQLARKSYQRFPPIIRKEPPSNPWHLSIDRYINVSDFSREIRLLPHVTTGDPYGFSTDWEYVPLFEGKLLHQYDHRFATYIGVNESSGTQDLRDKSPSIRATCLYFLPTATALRRNPSLLGAAGLLALRDITNRTNERGVIAAIIPAHITDYTIRVIQTENGTTAELILLTILNSFAFDYLARQRIGGTHVSNYILEQTPCPTPTDLDGPGKAFITPRAIELTYTAWDIQPLAAEISYNGPPFHWDDDRRLLLRCEIDAFYFRLYGLEREDAAYILDTFPIVRRKEEAIYGEYRTKRIILEMYDAMAQAIGTGKPYQTRVDPPPADPSCRHPKKKIGILAFGSLIQDPGSELKPKIAMRIRTQTPFPVEYARFSAKRGGGPTLVPYESGSPVSAEILVLDDEVTVDQARDMLWRRETGKIGSGETYPAGTSPNSVLVEQFSADPCVSAVLHTDFHPDGKVANPRAEELARRAIQSVGSADEGEDGITYLMNATACGIQTPLTAAYREQILLQTYAGSLEEALKKTREAVTSSKEGSRA